MFLGDDNGHENFRRELEQLIIDCHLEGHVRIAKHTNYITEAYKIAKLVVSTSIEPEAFGRVVLEAQAMGKPVIATNHGGPQETVIPNVTGWLVSPGNIDELTYTISNILTLTEEETAILASQAMSNAQQFSLDTMCEKTLVVYGELLANGS